MRIYIDDDFDISFTIHNPDWIFEKLPCLTNYPHGIEHTSEVPFISIRPYIEIDNLEQLFKLSNDIADINDDYMLVVDPYDCSLCITSVAMKLSNMYE